MNTSLIENVRINNKITTTYETFFHQIGEKRPFVVIYLVRT
jgi:hypothetical protein